MTRVQNGLRSPRPFGGEGWGGRGYRNAARGAATLVAVLFAVSAAASEPIHYDVDLTNPSAQFVHVNVSIPDAAAGTVVQIPTWNCLYQIRDFVKNVSGVAGDCDGQPADLSREDQNTWRGPARPCGNLTMHYSVYADTDGPFDSMLNSQHAFLNLAMLLFYLPRERVRPVEVQYHLPGDWKLATFLDGEGTEFHASNYDALVDSPVEAGHFAEYDYEQDFTPSGGISSQTQRATIRVIVDADRSDYSPDRLLPALEKITTVETQLMQDLPFHRYTFLLHFPRSGGSTGGMEHRFGTAIGISAADMRENQGYLESVAAHEFFHAWNVKRIRPQALEPIDYIHGNDTRDLWFCEGVTNTYAQLVLLRAGLIDRDTFYERVAGAVETLQERSARSFQSVETSGREAWLEKYPDYNRPDRSISYYNKGELLGYLLDLGMREASGNAAGLDDVMRRLNQDFARAGRFYTLADLTAIISQLAPGFDVNRFWADYLHGTAELDYLTYLSDAGLELTAHTSESPEPGFSASRDAAGALEVDAVDGGSDAARAELEPGDLLTAADGRPLPFSTDSNLPDWRPGQFVTLQTTRDGVARTLKFRVGVNQEVSYQISEQAGAGAGQLRVREGWLDGTTQASQGAR